MATLATTHCAAKHFSRREGDSNVQQPCASSLDINDRLARHFVREAETNRRQIQKLERELEFGECRKNGWTDPELDKYDNVLEKELNTEKMNLQKHLMKIHSHVRKFHQQLTDVKEPPDLKTLEEIMSQVETSMNTLKEEQQSRFEELLKEERTCTQEIRAYKKKIENWGLAVKSDPKLPAPTVKTKLLDRDLPAEVRAVEVFLKKTGGLYGGWDKYDHQTFLEVWTKHSGKPAYMKEAMLYLPDKTLEEVVQHEDWHRELINLQDRKREAIQRWKANKHQERQARIQSQKEEKKEEKKAHQHRTEEEKKLMAHRLEIWREEKRIEEERSREERRRHEELVKRVQEKEERRRRLEVKLTIEEHQRLRREQEEEEGRRRREEEQREMKARRKEAAEGIKHFKERDLLKVQAKLQEKQLKEEEEEERQRRIAAKLKEKVNSHINRDPSRLTGLTKGWEERMKHVGPSGGGPVQKMFHRAVPTWRQGL